MDPRVEEIRAELKTYPDFPKKGIEFCDIMPIFRKPAVFRKVVDLFAEHVRRSVPNVHTIAGIEARGFLLGPPLALALNVPFVPIRKAGKLPGSVKSQAYDLEYGQDKLEVQLASVSPGKDIVVIDDLLATGGKYNCLCSTLQACARILCICCFLEHFNAALVNMLLGE
uniref:adenine phosphoribosyltransferase n=1 Tax=Amblyomma maculatum TaxID=34609 RepID=G3MSV0_AMBMU